MGNKFRKIFNNRLQRSKQNLLIIRLRRNVIKMLEMLFLTNPTEIIDNKTDKINVEADSKRIKSIRMNLYRY